MAVLSTQVGFSAAFGAFVMGSILAETIEADKIIRLVDPVKTFWSSLLRLCRYVGRPTSPH